MDEVGRLLSLVAERASRDMRRRIRAALRAAFIASAGPGDQDDGAWRGSCYKASRDLERLLREAQGYLPVERSWLRHGWIVTIRRRWPVRIRSGIRYGLISAVQGRFIGFRAEADVWHDWLWSRIRSTVPEAGEERRDGAAIREEYELVYGRGARRET